MTSYPKTAALMRRGAEFLGSEHAILCGAMSWVSERNLVSAISNAGGFGVIACGAMTPELLDAEIAATKEGKVGDGFDEQCSLTFANIGAALASQGAGFGNIVEFTTYLVHSQDIPRFMAWRQREFPKLFPNGAYPPNTLLMIDRLVKEELLIEVSAVAAL